jgi:peptidoglycan/LPS O-acetylase OafA/YrhL
MFGLLRTTLSLMVMVYHLFLGVTPLGTYAVFGFYVISGYLMTYIMHETYGYSRPGMVSFALNRFLRLYPQYWIAAIFSILLIVWLGADIVFATHPAVYLPEQLGEVLGNLFMAFFAWSPNAASPRLVPASWAITVELTFYCLICIGISRTFLRVKVWFGLSLCYMLYTYLAGWSWDARYFPVPAASLPYSVGAAIFFVSRKKDLPSWWKVPLGTGGLFVAMIVNCLAWAFVYDNFDIGLFREVGFWINLALFAVIVYRLSLGREIAVISRRLDSWIGHYSYPIYLLHWQVGAAMSYLCFGETFHEFSSRGLVNLLVSMVSVFLISSVLIVLVDLPIQKIRSRVKSVKPSGTSG